MDEQTAYCSDGITRDIFEMYDADAQPTEDPELAIAEGRQAGADAARALGAEPGSSERVAISASTFDACGHWRRWLNAEIAVGGMDVMVPGIPTAFG